MQVSKNIEPILKKLNDILFGLGSSPEISENSKIEASYIKAKNTEKKRRELAKKNDCKTAIITINYFIESQSKVCAFSIYSDDTKNWLDYFLMLQGANGGLSYEKTKKAIKILKENTF